MRAGTACDLIVGTVLFEGKTHFFEGKTHFDFLSDGAHAAHAAGWSVADNLRFSIMMGLRRWLPDRAFDAVLRTQFAQPRP